MRISDWSSDVCSSDLRSSRRLWARSSTGRTISPTSASTRDCSAPSTYRRCRPTSRSHRISTFAPAFHAEPRSRLTTRSEEHTSELQSLMRISYAVFCLKKKIHKEHRNTTRIHNKANYKTKTNHT